MYKHKKRIEKIQKNPLDSYRLLIEEKGSTTLKVFISDDLKSCRVERDGLLVEEFSLPHSQTLPLVQADYSKKRGIRIVVHDRVFVC